MNDHDAFMRELAAKRGRVTVTEFDPGRYQRSSLTGVPITGVLVAWRPNRTRTGCNGEPITRSTYTAVVQPEGDQGSRQYPLTRYYVEPIR